MRLAYSRLRMAGSAFVCSAQVGQHQLTQLGIIGHGEAVRRAVQLYHWRRLDHRSRKRARRMIHKTRQRYPWALGYEASIASPHGVGKDNQLAYDLDTRTWFGTLVGVLKASGGTGFDVSNPKYNGGAVGNGIKDDTLAAQLAGADANAKGGGIVWFPATPTNVYGISGSLTLYTNVTYAMPWGTSLTWIGGAQGGKTYMIGCVAVSGIFVSQCGLFEVTLNANNAGNVYGLRIDSVRYGAFRTVQVNSVQGTAGLWAIELLSSVGATSANNTAICIFSAIVISQCFRGFRFNGNQNGTGVTNNWFFGGDWLTAEAWIDFEQWCDSNYFYGSLFGCQFGATGAFRGVTCGNAVTDLGIHSERFYGCSMDTNSSGMAGAVAIVLNICSNCMFHDLFSSVGGVAGVTTFNQGTLFTFINGQTVACRIEWINQALATGSNRVYIFEIGSLSRTLSTGTNVNGAGFQGADTGNPGIVVAVGADTNVGLALNGQGTGAISLNHNRQNWMDASGANSGGAVQLTANGVDADIPFHLTAKGNGELRLNPSKANFLAVFAAAAAAHPQLVTEGSDSNPNLQLVPKGTTSLVQIIAGLAPATDARAAQTGQIFMGSGVPANGNGNNGDVYHRTDTPGTANQRLYVRSAGAWVGIV